MKIQWSFVKAMCSETLILQGKGTIWCTLTVSKYLKYIITKRKAKRPSCSRDWDMKIFNFPCHWFEGRPNLS